MLNPVIKLNSGGRFVNIVSCDSNNNCPPFVILERRDDDLVLCPTCRQWLEEGPDILLDELVDVLKHYDTKTPAPGRPEAHYSEPPTPGYGGKTW